MAEISDAKLAEYAALEKLANELLSNPKTKADTQRLIKTVNPSANIPELDLRESYKADLKAATDKIEGLEKLIKETREVDEYQRGFDEAAKKYGLTDEGKPKVLELMKERQIRDPEAGMLLFNQLNPPPQPSTTSGWLGSMMFDDSKDSDLAKWMENPAKMRDQEIAAWASEQKLG